MSPVTRTIGLFWWTPPGSGSITDMWQTSSQCTGSKALICVYCQRICVLFGQRETPGLSAFQGQKIILSEILFFLYFVFIFAVPILFPHCQTNRAQCTFMCVFSNVARADRKIKSLLWIWIHNFK